MAKPPRSATRRKSITAPTSSPGATTTDLLQQRMLAFAGQLGRLAGTVRADTAGWMDSDALKKELTRVRDGAAEILEHLAGRDRVVGGGLRDAAAVAQEKPATEATPAKSQGRSGGLVDAPGKKHRPPLPADPGARRADSQAAKVRAAKTMEKTNRRRGRG